MRKSSYKARLKKLGELEKQDKQVNLKDKMKTSLQLAEDFLNGNLDDVIEALSEGGDPMTTAGRAMQIHESIRGQYGSRVAFEYVGWLQKKGDLK